ncbi:MAG: polymorphic toxin type 15 domain-containing protein [Rhizobacter sp.]
MVRLFRGAAAGLFPLLFAVLCAPAWSADQLVKTPRRWTFHESTTFPNAQAACQAYVRKNQPGTSYAGLDEYKEGDTAARCLWRTKDGELDGMQAVYAHLDCPANANSRQSGAVETGQCECNEGFTARNGACVSPGAPPATAAATPAAPPAPPSQAACPADNKKAQPARMPQHAVACFATDRFQDAKKLKEFAAQLRRQQDALNQMSVGDFIGGMQAYADLRQSGPRGPRQGQEAKQKQMREQYRKTMSDSMRESMACRGVPQKQIDQAVDQKVAGVLGGLQALHEPDINVAGGAVTRLGDAEVNGEIGRQWVAAPAQGRSDDSRRYALLAAVLKANESGGDTARLNVVLEPCRQ